MRKLKGSSKRSELFKTRIVPGKPGSGKLFDEELVTDGRPVECLGITFPNDEERRGLDWLEPGRWTERQINKIAYVAVTRARQRLFMPYCFENSLIQRILEGL